MSANDFFGGEFSPLGQPKKLEKFVFNSVNLTKNELSFFGKIAKISKSQN
jgi:hypothetical protein